MSKPKILVQLDADPQPSVFDSIVAVDAGVDHLLRHHGVAPSMVRDLVHGAIFTRGVPDLNCTAIFVGGNDVAAGEALLEEVTRTFFGPMRVSVMLDSGGANTTAAAAVLAAGRHADLTSVTALVLGATGPVGQRVVRLLAAAGATVRAGSRDVQRATNVCQAVGKLVGDGRLEPVATDAVDSVAAAIAGSQVLVAAGAAGAQLLSAEIRRGAKDLQVAIDLNAVPPVGLAGIEPMDKGQDRDGAACYGAIGVGGMKMKIHKAAIRRLFESNGAVLDAPEIFALGLALDQ